MLIGIAMVWMFLNKSDLFFDKFAPLVAALHWSRIFYFFCCFGFDTCFMLMLDRSVDQNIKTITILWHGS